MKSRTEILVPLAAIQAVPIAVIAWYRLHRYAWYRYSAIVNKFLGSLEENPFQGTSLGMGVYKTRMAVSSKGKGKSGGVRVLTYTVQKVNPEKIVITLLSIFDKSDIENVSDGYIKSLVKEVKNQYED